jgi:hypothetical protein
MATIRELKRNKGKVYHAQLRASGYSTESKTFDTKQEAEDWVYDKERDTRERTVNPRGLARRRTVRDAVKLYLSKIDHKSAKNTVPRCTYYAAGQGRPVRLH